MTTYATPTDFWQLAAPPVQLFQDEGLEPGSVSAVTAGTNTGLGSMDTDPASNPRDAWTVSVACSSGGEINTDGVVNPGKPPSFIITLTPATGPAIVSRKLTPDGNGRLPYTRGGFTLLFSNGSSGSATTLGSGNAALLVTPERAGLTIALVQPTTILAGLSVAILNNAVTVSLGTDSSGAANTTATALAAYLAVQGLPMTFAAGGNGSGIVQPASATSLAFASFVSGDSFSFTTQPSPDVVRFLNAESDYADGFIPDSFIRPLTLVGDDLKTCVCQRALARALERRGLDKAQDFAVYFRADEKWGKWLDGVADGNVRPAALAQTGPAFPTLVPPTDPLHGRDLRGDLLNFPI